MRASTEHELETLMNTQLPLEVRRKAANQLGNLHDEGAIPALAVLLTEVELALVPDVRRAAVALGATRHLASSLGSAAEAERIDALRLLGYLCDPSAVPALLAALEDGAPRVREQAAQALIVLRAAEAEPHLTRHLFEDADPGVRMATAQALGELGGASAIASLDRALETESDGFARVILELWYERARRAERARMIATPERRWSA